ncbi:hypothetical protein, partial [Porphyromonas gingivalis]
TKYTPIAVQRSPEMIGVQIGMNSRFADLLLAFSRFHARFYLKNGIVNTVQALFLCHVPIMRSN